MRAGPAAMYVRFCRFPFSIITTSLLAIRTRRRTLVFYKTIYKKILYFDKSKASGKNSYGSSIRSRTSRSKLCCYFPVMLIAIIIHPMTFEIMQKWGPNCVKKGSKLLGHLVKNIQRPEVNKTFTRMFMGTIIS